jgi:exodeoxyribonuclease VII large subunit
MSSPPPSIQPQRDVYSVSRLNSEVRAVLEGSFPLLWVEGEISNLAQPASGHIYFSLKDAHSQVRCAMFRMKRQRLRFAPANGLQVLIRARVSLYEGRGEFQLIAEHMEPSGEGALRQAFEQLKQKLDAEGLFDSVRKRPLPPFPRRIGLITSPSGAAVRDVLTVLRRRSPATPVIIYPTQVQGEEAPLGITRMITLAGRRAECDLLILARGGGSLEDLAAFNDESVARAVAASEIPIISAIGHEIDFTISDFSADRRAPTPSAAAEMATPDRAELEHKIGQLGQRIASQARLRLSLSRHHLESAKKRLNLLHPGSRLNQRQQRLDDLQQRIRQILLHQIQRREVAMERLSARLQSRTPSRQLSRIEERRRDLRFRLDRALESNLQQRKQKLATFAAKLNALSPLATLERGYSISRKQDGSIIQNSEQVKPGDQIEALLAHGSFTAVVKLVSKDN